MPATRRKQSNAMLYTLIIFVGLFIIATTIAVFYYVKAEEFRISSTDLKSKLGQFASEDEQDTVGSIVGEEASYAASYIRIMVDYLDKAMVLVVGGAPGSDAANKKINNMTTQTVDAMKKVADILKKTDPNVVNTLDPNLTGLINVVGLLSQKLQNTQDSKDKVEKDLADLFGRFEKTNAANAEAYKTLMAEKDKLVKDYATVKSDYDDLSEELKQSKDDQVKSVQSQLDRERANLKTLNAQYAETQAVLSETQKMLADAKEKLASFGKPQRDSMAYAPDGQILSIDAEGKIAYVNLGSNDHVYRGLTFAVYDKGAYIGDAQGKAEVEIFDIADSYSIARVIKSEINKPILKGDIAANLIWDSKKVNEFVIAGDFDLNEDGNIDYDAAAKIQNIIEKWGGKVTDKISIDTDFLILGKQPQVLEKPSLEQQEADPTALQKYEAALEKLNQYNSVETRANSLWIPVFTYEKFIYLIGYKEKVGQAGTF
jgi:hypothetical protein